MRRWVHRNCRLIWSEEASGDLRRRFHVGVVREQRAANPGVMEGVEVKTDQKEFEWIRREAHLECRVWGGGVGCLRFWFLGGGYGWWFFPLFRPSLQQERIEVERYRGESGTKSSPHGSPPVPQGRKTSRDSPFDGFGILIVGALWKKSWKANWMWRLEAVREPGLGGGLSF